MRVDGVVVAVLLWAAIAVVVIFWLFTYDTRRPVKNRRCNFCGVISMRLGQVRCPKITCPGMMEDV